MALTKIQAAGLTADLIDETKLADNSIDSEHYNDGSIDNAHLADDAVGVAELSATGTASSSTFLRGDNSWVTPTDTNTQLSAEEVQDIVGAMFTGNTETNITATYEDSDGTIDLVSTDTNTTYSVGDGGLTTNDFTNADHTKLDGIAASANNYVHPNHTGEVTSTADGATVIADDTVDEANLKISNAGSNGQYLSKQSGNTGGLTWADVTAGAGKNLIINGNFRVAQRSGSMVAVSDGSNDGYQSVDRWGFSGNWGSGAVNVGQSSETPAGFGYSYHVDVTTAYAGANGVTVQLWQKIEAQELANCGWDYTSSSSYLTLSFWVKSPKTGTHAITLETYDGDSQYRVLTYSVSSANTWEKKSIQIPGGSNVTIDNDAQVGMTVYFMMTTGSDYHNTADAWDSSARFGVTGQVNVLDNTANNFYLTGVQLETGSSATDFEHRSYSDELARCQRYYQLGIADGVVKGTGSGSVAGRINFQQTMRAEPAIGKTSGDIKIGDMISWSTTAASPTINNSGYKTWGVSQGFSISGMSGFSSGGIYRHENNSSQAVFTLSAEL